MDHQDTQGLVRQAVGAAENAERLAAFGKLVERFAGTVHAFAYYILGDFHLAEDAAQATFLTAFLRLGDLRQPEAFPGWLRQLARTACNRLTRRRHPTLVPLEDAATLTSNSMDPAHIVERGERIERMVWTLGQIPEPQREVTVLFYGGGHSHQQIAAFLQIPVTTVKNRLHRARKHVKERMLAMVRDEFSKYELAKGFAARVLSLAQVVGSPGKRFEFQFANGVRVRTRVDRIVRDEDRVHLIVCGPSEVYCHSPASASPPDHLDSFVLVPSTLTTALVLADLGGAPCEGYELTSAAEQAYDAHGVANDAAVYRPLATVSGRFDLLDEAFPFGFVRIGQQRREFACRDPQGKQSVYQAAPEDVYVSPELIATHRLKHADVVECTCHPKAGN